MKKWIVLIVIILGIALYVFFNKKNPKINSSQSTYQDLSINDHNQTEPKTLNKTKVDSVTNVNYDEKVKKIIFIS